MDASYSTDNDSSPWAGKVNVPADVYPSGVGDDTIAAVADHIGIDIPDLAAQLREHGADGATDAYDAGKNGQHSVRLRLRRRRSMNMAVKSGHPELLHAVEARRLAQIKAISTTLSPDNLRALFRLMDIDNNRLLSVSELTNGLEAMGFAKMGLPQVASRLLEELDTDRSGSINEQEFVLFFQRLQRHELHRRLSAYAADEGKRQHVITAVVYTARAPDGNKYIEKTLSAKDITGFLDEYVLSEAAKVFAYHVWVDVVGFDDSIINLISDLCGVHTQIVQDAFVYQRQKVDIVRATHDLPHAGQKESAGHTVSPPPSNQAGGADAWRMKLRSASMCKHEEASVITEETTIDSVRLQLVLHTMAIANPPYVDTTLQHRATSAAKAVFCCRKCRGQGHETIDAARIKGRKVALERAKNLADTYVGIDTGLPNLSSAGAGSERIIHRGCCGRKHLHQTAEQSIGLASKAQLSARRPDLAMEQFSMLVINENFVLTLRSPTVITAGQRAFSTTNSSVISILFAGIRRGIAQGTVVQNPLYTSSIRGLVCHILDAITQYNFSVRDELKDWEQRIHQAVHQSPSPFLSSHLYALSALSDMFKRELEPLVQTFGQVEHAYREGPDESKLPTLMAYFSDQLPTLTDIRDDINAVSSDVASIEGSVENMKALLESESSQFMNRILFTLTGVTTLFMPFSVISGYFGMNFDFAAVDGGYGVIVFWLPSMLLFFLLLCCLLFSGAVRMIR